MWLIIRDSDSAVIGTLSVRPPAGVYGSGVTLKEWAGDEPHPYDPLTDTWSTDPTLADPGYADFEQSGVDFLALRAQAATEITWLDTNIPLVDIADLADLRVYLERVMRQNRQTIKAWRYIAKRLI